MAASEVIGPFRGQYRFLSNFYVESSGRANENFFQAAKTQDEEARAIIFNAPTAREAKFLGSEQGMAKLSRELGREIKLREDWEQICDEVMAWSLNRKFQDPALRGWLLATGESELVEITTWHDLRWGVCTCRTHQGQGENRLGRLLMDLRAELRAAG